MIFSKLALGGQTEGTVAAFVRRREEGYARLVEQTLAVTPFLAGPEFTCADVMSLYCLRSPRMLGGRDDLPNARSYVERISQRPAYIRAMRIAGPDATPPAAA